MHTWRDDEVFLRDSFVWGDGSGGGEKKNLDAKVIDFSRKNVSS